MRKRAYRPEVSRCLESRSLLSGVAGTPADPVVFPRVSFARVREQIQQSFQLVARDRVTSTLPDDLYNVAVLIPFGRVDGLGVTINRILAELRQDLAAHVPNAVLSARNEVLAATREQVEARVRAGDVVVR